jgi:hypothetical protein
MFYRCKKTMILDNVEEYTTENVSWSRQVIYAIDTQIYNITECEVYIGFPPISVHQPGDFKKTSQPSILYMFKNEQKSTHLLFKERLNEHFEKIEE